MIRTGPSLLNSRFSGKSNASTKGCVAENIRMALILVRKMLARMLPRRELLCS